MDYTKGIVERLMAVEKVLEKHPFYLERLTMVQIGAPSRSRIPSYVNLRRQVEETAERINQRYQTTRLEAHPADRAAVQPCGGGSLVPRGGCVPGDLASRWDESGGQGVCGRARR